MKPNEIKFKAMGLMADEGKDIRLSNTLVECKSVKQGSLLTFGIDDETGRMIRKQMSGLQNTHIVICLVINAGQFEDVQKALNDATERTDNKA
jgi:hypothetical protein